MDKHEWLLHLRIFHEWIIHKWIIHSRIIHEWIIHEWIIYEWIICLRIIYMETTHLGICSKGKCSVSHCTGLSQNNALSGANDCIWETPCLTIKCILPAKVFARSIFSVFQIFIYIGMSCIGDPLVWEGIPPKYVTQGLIGKL